MQHSDQVHATVVESTCKHCDIILVVLTSSQQISLTSYCQITNSFSWCLEECTVLYREVQFHVMMLFNDSF